jgi:4-hydroxybenzoate polyprenyltransferase
MLRLLHPFPTLMNMLATLLFAGLALGARPSWQIAVPLVIAIGGSQATIGIANDLADRALDRATKKAKPLVAGLVTPREARVLLVAAVALAAVGAAQFGPLSLGLVALGTGLGLAYDLGLKRTTLSWLPYLLAIPLEPIWVWVALGQFTPRLLWLYPIGSALLLALHLANALSDWQGDSSAGVIGLAQQLGRRRAQAVLWIAALLPAALATILGLVLPYRWERFGPALTLALLPIGAGMVLVRRRPDDDATYRTVFGLLIVSTITLAVGWLAGAM